MQPSSKQLHGYVGRSYELAAQHHCLRQGDNYWAMTFPRVSSIESTADGSMVETDRRISMRIGRFGYQGWSLTVFDVLETTWPELTPQKELVYEDGQPDVASLFSGPATPFSVLRSIYKIRWALRNGLDIASRRTTVHTRDIESDDRLQAGALLTQLEACGELMFAELDIATVTKQDVDFMRNELENHMQAFEMTKQVEA